MEETYRSQFRLPYGLYERLKAVADMNGRSLNAELVFRLEQALAVPELEGSVAPSVVEDLERVSKRLAQQSVVSSLRMEYESARMRCNILQDEMYAVGRALVRERDPEHRAAQEQTLVELREEAERFRVRSDELMARIQVENTRLLSLMDRDFNTHKPKPTDPL